MNEAQEWDAIGISRRIHITCARGYKKQGSEQFVCLSDGTWKTDLICSLEGSISLKKILVEYAFDSLFFCKIFPIGLHPHFDWLINSFFYCKHGKKDYFFNGMAVCLKFMKQ